jgi:hypothetical protein
MESPEAVYRRQLLENLTRLALEQGPDTKLGYAKMAPYFLQQSSQPLCCCCIPPIFWVCS